MEKEIILAKALNEEIEGIIIRIEEDLPSILEFGDLYDPNIYFKTQAKKLSDALYSNLPYMTLHELVTIMTKRMYQLDQNKEGIGNVG